MSIAIVIPSLGEGGAERIAAVLASGWAERGERVSLITFSGILPREHALHPAVRRTALGSSIEPTHLAASMLENVRRVRKLRETFRREQPDVALALITAPAVISILAAKGLPTRVIACEHSYPGAMPMARHWHWLRARTYPDAARVAMLTQDGLDWLKQRVPGIRGEVMPNPVMLPLPVQGRILSPDDVLDRSAPLVLAAGRLIDLKRYDLAIDAFAQVASERPDARFVILGEGPDRPQLEAQIERLGLKGRVLLPGWAGNLADWYGRARLLLLSSRVEGFPNVLLEAMSHGCPAVSLDILTGPRDIITDGRDGLLVPPEEGAAGLAAAMRQLLGDDRRHAAMAAAALEVRDRFALSTILKRWQRVFAELDAAPVATAGVGAKAFR